MLAIEVELLTGRYAATEHNDRSRVRFPWPCRKFGRHMPAPDAAAWLCFARISSSRR